MNYADWKAPKQDSQTLVWPEPDALIESVHANGALLRNTDVLVQNMAFRDLREEARAFAGVRGDEPLILTGHQTELWHPGVWAKNAMIDAVARATHGVAMHLAVDTDSPKHLELRWPGFSMPIADDARAAHAQWSGLLDPPTPSHLNLIETALRMATKSFGYEPVLGQWIQSLRMAVLDGLNGSDLPKAIATASHQLDWSLGLEYSIQTLSPTLGSRPWLAFAFHLLARADRFADSYNAALACYRKHEGIDSTTRPMPDLIVGEKQIEMPFWLDELHGPRRHRMSIERREGKLFLHRPYSDESIEMDPTLHAKEAAEKLHEFLLRHRLRVTPRALTLTMFMRLFVSDLFVHGIGGGRYDQIADRIISNEFGIEPPRFAVCTATMFLPQALVRERACVPCVLRDGHSLRHAVIGKRKHELVSAIAQAPRNSRERAELFLTMHRELRAGRETSEALRRWKITLEEMRNRALEDAVVFDREVFYAVQPRERLATLMGRLRKSFAV